MALTQISTDGIKNGTITGSDLATNIDLVDNQKLRLGTGNDLQIFHNGTHTFIQESGSGALQIRGANLILDNADGSKRYIDCNDGGSVELYHNGSKKLETTSSGIAVTGAVEPTGHVKLDDDRFIYFGTGDDFIIGHQSGTPQNLFRSTDGATKMVFQGGSETMMVLQPQGQVELYYDNDLHFATTANGVKTNGDLSFRGDGDSEQILFDASDAKLKFIDNKKATFGDSDDLQIYHDASDSIISNTTGVFYIQNTGDLRLRTANTEAAVHCVANGAVELYHNNSKKFETTSYGAIATGNIAATVNVVIPNDTGKFLAGESNDLQIYHDGSHSFIDSTLAGGQVLIRTKESGGTTNNAAKFMPTGAVELYYDGSKKFETTSTGITVSGSNTTGSRINGSLVLATDGGTTNLELFGSNGVLRFYDNRKASFGTGDDLKIYHDGSESVIGNSTGTLQFLSPNEIRYRATTHHFLSYGNDETMAKFIDDGAVELYHNGSKKLHTFDSGVVISGDAQWMDGHDAQFGSSADLKIFHDGTHSRIKNSTGDLFINSDTVIRLQSFTGSETMAKFFQNGAAELYHDNSKKFETTSDGVNIVDNVLKFQGQSNRHIKYRPGENDILYEFDSGDFYRQNIGSSRHEFFAGNVYKLGINTSGLLFPNTGTLSQNAMYFESGASTNEYSTMFGVTNYPDASGFSDQNDGFWAKIKSKGGCVVIINSDGGRNDGRNGYDHFSVYHREGESTNGKRAFSVDHVGGIQCGQAGINIDREWGNQPSFSMTRDCNDGTNNTDDNAYFRFHGTSRTHSSWTGGSNGADFSANMLLDGGNYNASDRRAKTDIVDCPYGLAEVLKLRPRKYQLVNSQLEPQGDDNINLGFIAQELMEILPEPVNYLKNEDVPNEKGFCRAYILDMNEVVPVLTKAIQELAAKVAVLETEVAALKTA